ncbi:Protein of unknown function [Pyronema omphalodes CBS 100304]|uniref:Uncharacterized protein n=1 Tax=Pyronema omphalodes (strain CBS 100304) TaxID=1076935 RepID=U4KW39_PYROM|nr:Protein of unknown function [Pyronema omphalodes CBS 100304]
MSNIHFYTDEGIGAPGTATLGPFRYLRLLLRRFNALKCGLPIMLHIHRARNACIFPVSYAAK